MTLTSSIIPKVSMTPYGAGSPPPPPPLPPGPPPPPPDPGGGGAMAAYAYEGRFIGGSLVPMDNINWVMVGAAQRRIGGFIFMAPFTKIWTSIRYHSRFHRYSDGPEQGQKKTYPTYSFGFGGRPRMEFRRTVRNGSNFEPDMSANGLIAYTDKFVPDPTGRGMWGSGMPSSVALPNPQSGINPSDYPLNTFAKDDTTSENWTYHKLNWVPAPGLGPSDIIMVKDTVYAIIDIDKGTAADAFDPPGPIPDTQANGKTRKGWPTGQPDFPSEYHAGMNGPSVIGGNPDNGPYWKALGGRLVSTTNGGDSWYDPNVNGSTGGRGRMNALWEMIDDVTGLAWGNGYQGRSSAANRWLDGNCRVRQFFTVPSGDARKAIGVSLRGVRVASTVDGNVKIELYRNNGTADAPNYGSADKMAEANIPLFVFSAFSVGVASGALGPQSGSVGAQLLAAPSAAGNMIKFSDVVNFNSPVTMASGSKWVVVLSAPAGAKLSVMTNSNALTSNNGFTDKNLVRGGWAEFQDDTTATWRGMYPWTTTSFGKNGDLQMGIATVKT